MLVKPKLNKILNERGLSQLKFATDSNISQNVITRFDKSVQIRFDNLFAIAKALNLNVEQLFEVTED